MGFNHQQYNTQYLLKDIGEAINDAKEEYGVRIVQADVAEGETYWQVIGVHHLLPLENFGNHHVYLEALDENGNRIKNPPVLVGWTWEGRRPDEAANPIPLDKPDFEAAGNLTMHFSQVVSVWIQGTGQEKSDRVENLHTAHADEPLPDGRLLNSVGHHSFYVVFQRTRKGGTPKGMIKGRVERGQGHKVRLLQNNQVVAEQVLDSDLAFKFEQLPLGVYQLEIVDTDVRQAVRLDAANKEVTLNLAVPPPDDSVVFGEIKNGQGKKLLLVKEDNIIARLPLPASGQYRFENLAGGNYSLVVFETNVRHDNIILDGTNSRRIILTVPETEQETPKTINHYLLLGPPTSRGRQTNLLLATDYILAFSVTVGFSVEQAKQASQVTIIGEGISQTAQQAIKDSGSKVEVLMGDAYDIEAKLNARIQSGQAFGE
jgi:hypothetical protein